MRLTVIGHGYVGLVTAAVFADLGNTVYCVGRTKEKIDKLKKGIIPIYEPGLEEVVRRNIKANRLIFTLSYKDALIDTRVVFIGVGTPSTKTGEADLTQVYKVAENIAANLTGYAVIACKSTVPVGTNYQIKKIISKLNKKLNFDIASCPEFLREGTALSDTLRPDRIVIGTDNVKAREALLELHKPINGARVLTDITTAEMIKYASNSLLATKISFANSISFICDRNGADVEKVMEGVGLDRRLGRNFLYPGVGYGGSCLPKDVKALIAQASSAGYDFELLKSVETVNRQASMFFIEKITRNVKKGALLGVLGLAFKPDTDDMRDAPSISIINTLLEKGFKIQAFDPQAIEKAKTLIKGIKYVGNPYEAANNSEGLIVITEWNEFRQLDLVKIKKKMKKPLISDGRNIYDPIHIRKLGFTYFGIGRS